MYGVTPIGQFVVLKIRQGESAEKPSGSGDKTVVPASGSGDEPVVPPSGSAEPVVPASGSVEPAVPASGSVEPVVPAQGDVKAEDDDPVVKDAEPQEPAMQGE